LIKAEQTEVNGLLTTIIVYYELLELRLYYDILEEYGLTSPILFEIIARELTSADGTIENDFWVCMPVNLKHEYILIYPQVLLTVPILAPKDLESTNTAELKLDIQYYLAANDNIRVKYILAKNLSTQSQILEILYKTKDLLLLTYVLNHPNCTIELREKTMYKLLKIIREYININSFIAKSYLLKLIDPYKPIPSIVYLELISWGTNLCYFVIARNQCIQLNNPAFESTIEAMIKTNDEQVWKILSLRSGLKTETYNILYQYGNEETRLNANMRLLEIA
jgi:hypothetical protein